MKKSIQKLFSILMLVVMLVDAAPVAALAESGQAIVIDASAPQRVEAVLPDNQDAQADAASVDYSVEGSTQILLSDLIRQFIALDIEVPNVDVAEVASVAFTGDHAVTVQQVSGWISYNNVADADVGENDFLLTSEEPFTTQEQMTLVLKNSGGIIEIGEKEEPEIEEEHTLVEGEYTYSVVEDPSELINLINPSAMNARGTLLAPQKLNAPKNISLNKSTTSIMNVSAGQGASVSEPQQTTGYLAYDVELTEIAAPAKQYQVTIPANVDMLKDMRNAGQNPVINNVEYELYHIHTDEKGNTTAEKIAADVKQENGVIESFTFEVDSFSSFVLKYTVDFVYVEKTGNISLNLGNLQENSNELGQLLYKNSQELEEVAVTDILSFAQDYLSDEDICGVVYTLYLSNGTALSDFDDQFFAQAAVSIEGALEYGSGKITLVESFDSAKITFSTEHASLEIELVNYAKPIAPLTHAFHGVGDTASIIEILAANEITSSYNNATVSNEEAVSVEDDTLTTLSFFDEVTLTLTLEDESTVTVILTNPEFIPANQPVKSGSNSFVPTIDLPASAELKAEDAEENKAVTEQAKAELGDEAEVLFYDLSIVDAEDKEIETGATVTLNLGIYLDIPEGKLAKVTGYVYHVTGEEPATQLDAIFTMDEKGITSVTFETDGFSVFGIAYTVDFVSANVSAAWSWPGQGSYSLSSVLEMIGITGDISTVTLDKKVDQGGTVNALYLEEKEDGWYLTSDEAFQDTFELMVVVDGNTYYFTISDAQAVDLKDISSITANLTTTGNIDREATINIDIEYTIARDKIEVAKTNFPWVYDMSSLCGDDKVFENIFDEPDGVLMSGGQTIGTYVIENNLIRIYPYASKISDASDLFGTIHIETKLNVSHTSTIDEDKISFPGASQDLEVKYKDKTLVTEKKVGSYYGDDQDETTVNVVQQTDGSYKLYYQIAVTPSTKAYKGFTITDTLTGVQTLDRDSITVINNGASMSGDLPAVTSHSDKGFTLDLVATLAKWNSEIEGGRTYYVNYTTSISATDFETLQTAGNKEQGNTVNVNYDGITGNDSTTVTPEFTKTITTNKRVGSTANDISHTNGNVTVKEVVDGDTKNYELYYEAELNTNAELTDLKLTDTIGSGQSLDASSVKLIINNSETITATQLGSYLSTGNPFTVNVSGYLGAQNPARTVPANTNIKVQYKTTMTELAETTNTADWIWNGGTNEPDDEITFTPVKADKVFGTYKELDNAAYMPENGFSAQNQDRIAFGVVVEDYQGEHLRGHLGSAVAGKTVRDEIEDAVSLPEKIIVYGVKYNGSGRSLTKFVEYERGENDSYTVKEGNTSLATVTVNPNNHTQGTSGERYVLFSVNFPGEASAYEAYDYFYIYYEVNANRVGEGETPRIGSVDWNNWSIFEGDVGSKTFTIDYGTPTISKRFVGWDVENNIAEWEIRVNVPEGVTLENWYVQDEFPTGWGDAAHTNNLGNLPFYEVTARGENGSTIPYTSENKGNIFKVSFPSLSENAIISVKTKCTRILEEVKSYFVSNGTKLYNEADVEKGYYYAEGAYYRQDYSFDKKGTFNKTNHTATWTVDINKDKTILENDIQPMFFDRIPEGMELVDGVVQIQVFGGNTNHSGQAVWDNTVTNYPVQVFDNEMGPVDLIAALRQKFTQDGNPTHAPDGLSGMYFRVTYTTRVTDEKMAEIEQENQDQGYLGTYTFTNRASLQDEGGTTLKTDTDTVTYEYGSLVSKTDVSADSVQRINYQVEINPDAQKINRGNRLILTDYISPDMTLVLDTIAVSRVDDENNTAPLTENVTVSYDDNSRVLTVYVPDETHARVTFSAIPRAGSGTYKNSVTLKGSHFKQDDKTEKYHTTHSTATLDQIVNAVTINKYDEHNLTQKLAGAQFKLYKCTLNDDGTIATEEEVIPSGENAWYQPEQGGNGGYYFTDANGNLTFSGILADTIYYWKEINPPAGYRITDGSNHYFVLYEVLAYNSNVSVQWNRLTSETRAKLKEQFRTSLSSYDDTTTTRITIAGRAPRAGETYSSNIYYLTDYTTPANTSYASLIEEVNAVNQNEAYELDNKVTEANNITVASVPDHYNWTYTNVQDTMIQNTLKVSKKMIGRNMAANEFSFMLYDASDLEHPLQTVKNTAANAEQAVIMAFNPQSYVIAGTYEYVIKERIGSDSGVVYDDSVYNVTVEVVEDYTEVAGVQQRQLRVASTTYTKNGETEENALFINRVNTSSLTVTKTFEGEIPQGFNKNLITFTVADAAEPENPVATFTYEEMEAGQKTITGLIVGHTYTVTETNADPAEEGCVCVTTYTINTSAEMTGRSATREMGSNAITVNFKNKYETPLMDLVVTKQWYTSTPNPVNPATPPATESTVYFNLYHKVDEDWVKYSAQPYAIHATASNSWRKTIYDLPEGEYKVVECSSAGVDFDSTALQNAGIKYFVGASDASAVESSDPATKEHNHLYIMNRLAQLRVRKQWRDKNGTILNHEWTETGSTATGVKKVYFKLQRTENAGASWTDVGDPMTMGKSGSDYIWQTSTPYNLPIFNPSTGVKYGYRIVETKIELANGNVLDGERVVAETYEFKQSDTVNVDYSSGLQLYDTNEAIWLIATNKEKDDYLTLQKVWVDMNGTSSTNSYSIGVWGLRFKIHAIFDDGTDDDVVLSNDYWDNYVEKINNSDYLYETSTQGVYEYSPDEDGSWYPVYFKYLFRAHEDASTGNLVFTDIPTYNGKTVVGFYFQETQIKVNETWTNVENSNYMASYTFNGSEFVSVPANTTTGTFTITNTERRGSQLRVTKRWLDENENADTTETKINYRVILVPETGNPVTLPNSTYDDSRTGNSGIVVEESTYKLTYNNGWPTAVFNFNASEQFSDGSKHLKAIYVVETDSSGNEYRYSFGGEITYAYTPDGGSLIDNKGNDANPVSAGGTGTVTITNMPKRAQVLPQVDKLWKYGGSPTATHNWPGAVQSIKVQVFRYPAGEAESAAVAVGDPVTIYPWTNLPASLTPQDKYVNTWDNPLTQTKKYVYIVRETEITLLENGTIVTKNLTGDNSYLVDTTYETIPNSNYLDAVRTTLTNRVEEEDKTYIQVTKLWQDANGTEKSFSEGQYATFRVKGTNNQSFVIYGVTNGTLNADNTITLNGTSEGWPTCTITLPKYYNGSAATYYVEEVSASSAGYYYTSYQLNNVVQSQASDCATKDNGKITIVNKDRPNSNIKVTKSWKAADGVTNIGEYTVDSVQFKLYYVYYKADTSDQWDTNWKEVGTFTIHRQADGTWEEVSLPELQADPDGKGDGWEARYFIQEMDGTNNRKYSGQIGSWNNENYLVAIAQDGTSDNQTSKDQNKYLVHNANTTVTITNTRQQEDNKIDIYKAWTIDGQPMTGAALDDLSVTMALYKLVNEGDDVKEGNDFTLNSANHWHYRAHINETSATYYVKEVSYSGIDTNEVTGITYVIKKADGTAGETYTKGRKPTTTGAENKGSVYVTNATSSTTNMTVHKVWKNLYDEDVNTWPAGTTVTVQLSKQKNNVVEPLTDAEALAVLSDGDIAVNLNSEKQSHTWNNLPKLTNGYKYTVEEIAVNGADVEASAYTASTVNDYAERTTTITNREKETTRLEIEKLFTGETSWLTDEQKHTIQFTVKNTATSVEKTYSYGTNVDADNARWEGYKLTILNLPAGDYEITESDSITAPDYLNHTAQYQVGAAAPTNDKASVHLTNQASVAVTITNDYDVPTIDVPVVKAWAEGSEPDTSWSMTAKLKYREKRLYDGNGTQVTEDWGSYSDLTVWNTDTSTNDNITVTITDSTEGSRSVFEDLPLIRQNDKEIFQREYTVEETALTIEGVDSLNKYRSTLAGNMNDGFTLTNAKAPELTVTKKWVDVYGNELTELEESQKTVYFKLGYIYSSDWDAGIYNDGKNYASVKPNAYNVYTLEGQVVDGQQVWNTVTFSNLPIYNNGDVKYYIVEVTDEFGSSECTTSQRLTVNEIGYAPTYIDEDGNEITKNYASAFDASVSGTITITNQPEREDGKLYLKKVWGEGTTRQDVTLELYKTTKTEENPTSYKVQLNGGDEHNNVPKGTKVTINWNVEGGSYLKYWIDNTSVYVDGPTANTYTFVVGNVSFYNPTDTTYNFKIDTNGEIKSINATYEEPSAGTDEKVGSSITLSSADNWTKTIDLSTGEYKVDLNTYDVYVKEVTSSNAYTVTYDPAGIGRSGAVGAGGLITITNTKTVNEQPQVKKTVWDINDSTGVDSIQANGEKTYNDTADHDMNDDIKYRVECPIPGNPLAADVTSYPFTLHDDMQGLKYKSGRMYFVVMHDDGQSDYYDVTTSFGMPSAGANKLTISPTSANGLAGITSGYLVENIDPHKLTQDRGEKSFATPEGSGTVYTFTAADKLTRVEFRYLAQFDNPTFGSNGNLNETWFTYGADGVSSHDYNRVFTYKLQVNKTDGTDALPGATFSLYKDTTGKPVDGQTERTWTLVSTIASTEAEPVTTFTWEGIDDGYYKLVETPPTGYQPAPDILFNILAEHEWDAVDNADPKLVNMNGTEATTDGYTATVDMATGVITIKTTGSNPEGIVNDRDVHVTKVWAGAASAEKGKWILYKLTRKIDDVEDTTFSHYVCIHKGSKPDTSDLEKDANVYVKYSDNGNSWNYTWKDLPRGGTIGNVNGAYTYEAHEVQFKYDKYDSVTVNPDNTVTSDLWTVTQVGNAITNTLASVDIEVNKAWAPASTWPSDVQSVTVQLQKSVWEELDEEEEEEDDELGWGYGEFKNVDGKTLTITPANSVVTAETVDQAAENEKAGKQTLLNQRFFHNLPKYDSYGKEIKYKVVETAVTPVSGATATLSDFAVTYSPTDGTTTDGLITVTNTQVIGSIKLTKQGTVNGTLPTYDNHTLIDGAYTFTVTGPTPSTDVVATVEITIAYGKPVSYKLNNGELQEFTATDTDHYVTVDGLVPGDYVITETPPTKANVSLYSAERGDGNDTAVSVTKAVTVQVTGGENDPALTSAAAAKFINNIADDNPQIKKLVWDINDTTGHTGILTSGEKVLNDTADHDIGDEIPYVVDCFIPSTYKNATSYAFELYDNMQNLRYVNGSGVVYFVMYDHTNGRSTYYDVTNAFTIAPDTTKGTNGVDDQNWQHIIVKPIENRDLVATLNAISGGLVETQDVTDTLPNIPANNDRTHKFSEFFDTETLTRIEFRYKATFNNPNFGKAGNLNETWFKYGSGAETGKDYNRVFTYKLELEKTEFDGTALTGAEFKLEKKIKGLAQNDGWQEVQLTSPASNTDKSATKFIWEGIDDGTYRLTETATPSGYFAIDPIVFNIVADHEVDAETNNNPKLTDLYVTSEGNQDVFTNADATRGQIDLSKDGEDGTIKAEIVNIEKTSIEATKQWAGPYDAAKIRYVEYIVERFFTPEGSERRQDENYSETLKANASPWSVMKSDLPAEAEITYGNGQKYKGPVEYVIREAKFGYGEHDYSVDENGVVREGGIIAEWTMTRKGNEFTNTLLKKDVSVTKEWTGPYEESKISYIRYELTRTITGKAYDDEGEATWYYEDGEGPISITDEKRNKTVTIYGTEETITESHNENVVNQQYNATGEGWGYTWHDLDLKGSQIYEDPEDGELLIEGDITYTLKEVGFKYAGVEYEIKDAGTVVIKGTNTPARQWSMNKAPASENDDAITFALTNTLGIEIKVTKQWKKDGSDKTFESEKNISFTLHQVLTPTSGTKIDKAFTDYTNATAGITNGVGMVTYNITSNTWNTVTIPNLPLTVTETVHNEATDEDEEVTYNASYYVVETAETADAGYVLTTTYSNENDAINPDADARNKAVSADGSTITIINTETAGVELPSTGGSGTTLYTLTGLSLLLGASLWLLLLRRRREQN